MCADHRKTRQQNDVDQETGIKPVTFPRTAITYHVHAMASTGSGNLYLEIHDDTAYEFAVVFRPQRQWLKHK